MATYDYRVGSSQIGEAYGSAHEVYVQERYLDFAQIAAIRSAAGLAALASADVLQLIGIPIDSLVIAVTAKVIKVAGVTFTFGLGDAGSATQYQTATNGNALGLTASAASAWKAYNAVDNVIMTINQNAIVVGQVLVKAVIARLNQTTGAAYGGLQN
jgi:hypothetical protein